MTYPAQPPTISGNNVTVAYFLNNPKYLQRLMNNLIQQRLIGDKLLSGRVDLTGSGSMLFEVGETIYSDKSSERVDALMEYPNTTVSGTPPQIASTEKWALATDISDEAIARNRWDSVNRALVKIANRIAFGFDALTLAAIGSAVTQTSAASDAWSNASADPFLDAMLAAAVSDSLNLGYSVDTFVLTPTYYARMVAAAKVIERLPREGADQPILTGNVLRIGGQTLLKSTNLPSGVNVMAVDSVNLGSIAYERLGGGYQGDPATDSGVESKVFRKESNDGVRIQVRKVAVPVIQEPGAGVKVTGA